VSDGLLLSRREKLLRASTQAGIVIVPSLLLAVAIAGLGDLVTAAFVAALAGLATLGVASSLRTRTGAIVFSALLLGMLVGLLFFTAYFIATPLVPGLP
jgi:hypothetical protein